MVALLAVSHGKAQEEASYYGCVPVFFYRKQDMDLDHMERGWSEA